MPKKKPVPIEDLIIPPQDQRICGIICVCQMVAVLSCVSLVYLTVAIYKPSIVAFQSGITEVPVMCTTTRGLLKNNCSWESCGEWCLSKTSGQCMQIYVHLRRNGTNVALASCVNSTNKTCYGIDQDTAHKSRCINEECKNLTGTFNCTSGQCVNITDAFKCTFEHTDKKAIKCSGIKGKTICQNITGLYDCHRGQCERIVPPYNCDRRCVDIPTRNKNLIFLSSDKVFLSQCQQALELETGVEIWNASSKSVFMASCYAVVDTPSGIEAYDCIDGTLLEPSVLTDLTNFTYLLHLNAFYARPVEDFKEYVPPEMSLTIANESKLKINLEGCVNTLMDECKEFFKVYGKDGSDYNARARFPCFYSELDMSTALARFSMSVAWKQFLIASIIPSVLFVVSCITLISCQRTVIVGDDAKFRFTGCPGGDIILPVDADYVDGGGGGGDSATPL